MNRALAIYLRNHAAAADAGLSLFRRAAARQRDRPYGAELAMLRDEVDQDRRTYRVLLRAVRTPHDQVQSAALRLGERVARLKPNGHLVRRAPLSDLIEVEAMVDAVRAKSAGWLALSRVAEPPWAGQVDINEQLARALDQVTRLEQIHRTVATRVFTA